MVFEKVRSIVAKVLEKSLDCIKMDSEFVRDLGADSIGVVEMIFAINDEFGIEVPDEVADKIISVGDVVRYIESVKK
ncbi:MAG: acyl carrier protein [Clostridia bacterium]|nr:acyl carrier protein [Clostridia bacterium]MDD3832261.1 acyl carrier protein [Clostridia bacterium]